MQRYYAILAPREDLFREMEWYDFSGSKEASFNSCFVNAHCLGIKFEYGMDLSDIKSKLKTKWLKERNGLTNSHVEKALADCIHAYVVFEDTAKMLAAVRKSWLKIQPSLDTPESRRLSYLAMLTCMHSEGTFVQILTEGREVWLTSDNELLRENAKWISKDHTIHKRLVGE